MRRMLVAALCLGLVPAAQAATAEQAEALIRAIAAAGCEVREDNNAAVLAAAGVDAELAAEIVTAMLADGRAEVTDRGLKLRTGGCN